jgi:hypothetical protein
MRAGNGYALFRKRIEIVFGTRTRKVKGSGAPGAQMGICNRHDEAEAKKHGKS